MTGERRINWAPAGETPKYRTEDDDPTGGNFVVAEDVGGATVLLQWNDTASQWEFAGDVDLGSNDITNVGSISTDEADITGETFVRLTRGNNSSSTSAGNWINAFDTEDKDARGEVSSQQFSPDESGEYEITATVSFGGNSTAGDECAIGLRNVTDSTFLAFPGVKLNGNTKEFTATFTKNLSSSKTYEIQAKNNDSSFVVTIGHTEGVIKRSVVHA